MHIKPYELGEQYPEKVNDGWENPSEKETKKMMEAGERITMMNNVRVAGDPTERKPAETDQHGKSVGNTTLGDYYSGDYPK